MFILCYYHYQKGEKHGKNLYRRTNKKTKIERGLTQTQLGDLCIPKMKDSAIRRYESGKVIPKTNTLQRIAKALNVSIVELDPDTYFWNDMSTNS